MGERKRIVITGASAGIGEAMARALSSDGNSVYLTSRRSDKLAAIASEIRLAEWRQCDVSNEEQVADFAEWVRQRASGVDVLINCAGIFGAIGPQWQVDFRDWRKGIEVNLFGTFLMAKFIVPLMAEGQGGRIINFAGGGAFDPLPNFSSYAVSKSAVVRLTETLAAELAPLGIAVNAVAPGFVATRIHDAIIAAGPKKAGADHYEEIRGQLQEGIGVPIEVPVECVRFLISDRADGLTGKTISANFDPWSTTDFQERIPEINDSELYTMSRINLVNLPDGPLRAALDSASGRRV